MSKIRTTKKTVFILTEGKTEEAYFSRIGEIVGQDTDWKYSVTVEVREIINGSKTDPINIVKEAKKSKKDYNEVWVVFDRDRERDDENLDAIKLAEKSKIKVSYSSISFEHWLILHFEKNTIPFERSDCESRSTKTNPIICQCEGKICASTYLKKKDLYPNFKKGYSLLFDDLQEKSTIAIENSAWLRNIHSPYTRINLLNPYSDVDFLICELMNINLVEYYSIGNVFIFDGIEIIIQNFVRNNNKFILSINFNIISQNSFVLNNNQELKLVDSNNNVFSYNPISTMVLEPNTNSCLELVFETNEESKNLKFKAITIGKYFLVDLIE